MPGMVNIMVDGLRTFAEFRLIFLPTHLWQSERQLTEKLRERVATGTAI